MLEIKADIENSALDLAICGTFEDITCEMMASFDAIVESLSEQDEILGIFFMKILKDYLSDRIKNPEEITKSIKTKEEIKIDLGALELMKSLFDKNNDMIDHEAERLDENG